MPAVHLSAGKIVVQSRFMSTTVRAFAGGLFQCLVELLKAYKDFAAQNRSEGHTAWLTFAISAKPPAGFANADVS